VPVNALLKPAQVAYILRDCGVRLLVTTRERLRQLGAELADCPALQTVLLVGPREDGSPVDTVPLWQRETPIRLAAWNEHINRRVGNEDAAPPSAGSVAPCIDSDMAAILYTSGSTGKPKGVVLSHRNMLAGAYSVASYLGNTADDRLLCVLPFSFDYGLSQLTTAFASGACAVLLNYLLLRDIVEIVERERVTGLAAVPPLWIQLSQVNWPEQTSLRYATNSGGAMPRATLNKLRKALPDTKFFLMYGLTEAFRSTYLDPARIDERPGSVGKAIPNAEVLVLRPDGSECAPDEPGELVHRGALVAMGYWNDPGKTEERFKHLPPRASGLPLPELAVWSGDTVRRDSEGYIYFVGRKDEMIKTSGYRVSPTEIEEVAYASGLVGDAAALGVPHPLLGQAIVLLATRARGAELDAPDLAAICKRALPGFMQPAWVDVRNAALPRNPNGKIDRKLLATELAQLFQDAAP
jgi:acyl-CoA ligase (AMP-forming) (exosortase A-associated)